MNVFKTRARKQLIHIVKELECSYRVNKIKNLTHLKDINPLNIKLCISLQFKSNFKKMTL